MAIGAASGSPGALVAQGTSSNPIVFTSAQQTPTAGDWGSIQFYTTADPSSKLEHCLVEYSGSSMNSSIYIYNASVDLSSVTIANSKKYDLYYYGTVGGTVLGCTFNSGIFLYTSSTSVSFSGNTFNHNNAYPTYTCADNVHSLVNGNNIYIDPATAYIKVAGGNITKDATWTSAVPINIVNNTRIQGADGADGVTTLTLEPGAKIKFNSAKYLEVGYTSGSPGALIAQGSP